MRKRALRFVALGYLLLVLVGPLSMVFWRAFGGGAGQHLGHAVRPEHGARVQADADHRVDRRAAEHGLRHRVRARDRASAVPGRRHRQRDRRPAARDLARRRRALAFPALRAHRLVRRLVRATRNADPLRAAVDGDRDDLRLAARSSRARSSRRCARSATSRSRRRARSARPGGRRSGGSRCRRSAGR